VHDIVPFAVTTLLVALALLVAVGSNRLAERIHVPTPALFLVAAALASDIWPVLGHLSAEMDSRIVTVALVIILFDGGMGLGWRRLRPALAPVLWLGVAGTVVTAAGLAVAGLGFVPGLGYAEAALLPAVALLARRRGPQRHAGLRILAKNE